jgi:hypothetical protein
MAAALVGLLASGATAEVTTERSASILVFPKVIADGTRETVIQITNTSNSMVHAHCFYVNGGLTFPDGLDGIPGSGDEVPSAFNPPLWTEIDFDIWLTKQQPTYWVVSEGRLINPDDPTCSDEVDDEDDDDDSADGADCPNAGFDPGRVPPVVETFTGELKCIEVDASGAPLSGNHLKGEATVVVVDPCDIEEGQTEGNCRSNGDTCEDNDDCPNTTQDAAKYNALGVIGLETNDSNGTLCLGGQPDPEGACPQGAEYNACPQTWILNHYADGAEDIFMRSLALQQNQAQGIPNPDVNLSGFRVHTSITVVPCAQNFETQVPETVTIQFLITNEFEQPFSASTSVTCWAELELFDINAVFDRNSVGTNFLQTRLRPSTGTNSGFMVVAEELHSNGDDVEADAAMNLHVEGERPGPDLIVIPAEQLTP